MPVRSEKDNTFPAGVEFFSPLGKSPLGGLVWKDGQE